MHGYPKDEPTAKNLVCKKPFFDPEENWKNLLVSNPLAIWGNQILAKLINQGIAAALFSLGRLKNFKNEIIFVCLIIAEIDGEGGQFGSRRTIME